LISFFSNTAIFLRKQKLLSKVRNQMATEELGLQEVAKIKTS